MNGTGLTRVADLIFWIVLVAILYMLVRPGSRAAQGVAAIADAGAAVVARATGA